MIFWDCCFYYKGNVCWVISTLLSSLSPCGTANLFVVLVQLQQEWMMSICCVVMSFQCKGTLPAAFYLLL